MQILKRARVGQQMLAALCYIEYHPGCAKIDVALAIHPGSTRVLPQSFAAGYPTVNRCIDAGWVSAQVDIDARVQVYQLTLTPEGFALLTTRFGFSRAAMKDPSS